MQSSKGFRMHRLPSLRVPFTWRSGPLVPSLSPCGGGFVPSCEPEIASSAPPGPPRNDRNRGAVGEAKLAGQGGFAASREVFLTRSHKARKMLDPGLRRGDCREVPHA
jgi:hypothetical protein